MDDDSMDEDSAETLQDAVYLLVTYYVERQKLPLEVIREFRPDWLDSSKYPRPTKKYASATHSGRWGQDNEWRYSLHGGGCRLIHTITGEYIDWDAPDLKRFDPYWFVSWLRWYLTQKVFFRQPVEVEAVTIILSKVSVQDVDAFRKGIFAVLEELAQGGKLYSYPDRTNRYELID